MTVALFTGDFLLIIQWEILVWCVCPAYIYSSVILLSMVLICAVFAMVRWKDYQKITSETHLGIVPADYRQL